MVRKLVLDNNSIRYFRWPENTGFPNRHFNNAVKYLARGNYIIHAFDDDIWFPNLLEDLTSELLKHPHLDWVHGRVKSLEGGKRYEYGGPLNMEALKKRNYIPLQGCMFKKNSFLSIGGFDEAAEMRYGHDWDLVIRAGQELRQTHVPEFVAQWEPGADGIVAWGWKKENRDKWATYWKKKRSIEK
jgi:GT2 family glycosyltransferase